MVRRDSAALADGGIGGGVGTVAMSLVMVGALRAGLVGELPPGRMAAALRDAVGLRGGPGWTRDALAVVLHLGVGAAAGALFALLRGRLRMPVPLALQGMTYGVVVWLVSYMGWVPAFGLLPTATRDEPRRPVVMVLAHLVYGAVLGALVARRSRRRWAPLPATMGAAPGDDGRRGKTTIDSGEWKGRGHHGDPRDSAGCRRHAGAEQRRAGASLGRGLQGARS